MMPTLRNSIRWELAILLLLQASSSQAQVPSPPQEFSADIVRRDASGAANGPVAKLHVSRQKTRIDSVDAPGGFFITDGDAGTAFFVRPAQHVYMDAKQSTPLTQIFVSVDPRDPCRQWQTAARIAGAGYPQDWQCERITSTMIDSHPVIEYQVLSPGHVPSRRWIESALGFPFKSQTGDGSTIALENIRIESQPPSLFSVPPDYRKLDPQALIERIKHSDVWADPGS
jgi:hypothetical protein